MAGPPHGEHSGVRRFALGQAHLEAGTATRTVCAPHPPTVPLGNRFDERQAQAHAAHALTGPGQAEKRLKNAVAVFMGHARATVTHFDVHLLALGFQGQHNAIALL